MNVLDQLKPETKDTLCKWLLYILGVIVFVIIVYFIAIPFVRLFSEGMVAQPVPQARQYNNHLWGLVQPWVGHQDAELRALNIMNSGPGVRFYTNSAQGLGQDPGRLDYSGLTAQLHGLTDKEKFYLYQPWTDEPQYSDALVNDSIYNPLAYGTGERNTA